MKNESMSAERKVFDHVILGVANRNEFRSQVIEFASQTMHVKMNNHESRFTHATSSKTALTFTQRFLVLQNHQHP